jgi:hypothetical protein
VAAVIDLSMRAYVSQVCDEALANVVGKRKVAVLVRLRAADVHDTISPVDVANRQVRYFLASKSETEEHEQERTVADMPRRVLLTHVEEMRHLDFGQPPRQPCMPAIDDLRKRIVPARRDRVEVVCDIPQDAAKNHQPRPLRIAAGQPRKLLSDERGAVAEAQVAPGDQTVREAGR